MCNYLWYTACRGGNEAQKEAKDLSKELAKELCWDARQENAFKHAYWSALMKIDVRMGDEDVPLVTTAHKMDHTLDLTTHEQVPYGSRESRLDVHNNQVGIKANRYKPGTEIPLTKEDVRNQLIDMVSNAVRQQRRLPGLRQRSA